MALKVKQAGRVPRRPSTGSSALRDNTEWNPSSAPNIRRSVTGRPNRELAHNATADRVRQAGARVIIGRSIWAEVCG